MDARRGSWASAASSGASRSAPLNPRCVSDRAASPDATPAGSPTHSSDFKESPARGLASMASPPGPGGRDRCVRLVQAASGVRSVGRHVDRSPPPSPYPICVTARCSRLPHLLKGVRSSAVPARTRTRCSVRPRSCAQPPICSRSSALTAARCSVRRLGRCAAMGAGSGDAVWCRETCSRAPTRVFDAASTRPSAVAALIAPSAAPKRINACSSLTRGHGRAQRSSGARAVVMSRRSVRSVATRASVPWSSRCGVSVRTEVCTAAWSPAVVRGCCDVIV
mmetsp:Transcript_19012/g.54329  ORF Transcript_19012/g.54329 Transcript_19012/m.54329 type:complete len:279 (+) Transcript_19012:511-1347(+)